MMTFYVPFFLFFIAIIWLGFLNQCSNGSGIGDSSSSQSSNREDNASGDSDGIGKMNDDDMLLNFQQNVWDAKVCHPNLQISGEKSLTIGYKFKKNVNKTGWFSVFAKQPIPSNISNTFYFEISVKKMERSLIFGFANIPTRTVTDLSGSREQITLDAFISLTFGFANKKQRKLFTEYDQQKSIYAYVSHGHLYNGTFSISGADLGYSYGVGDVVGVGVNLASQQIIFTKNGKHLASLLANNFADSSDSLYPFVSLTGFGDEIEANFGPAFKFDLATLN
ncbi:hypothetical protein niasHT_017994 [Heterodera trifolii]|uniref:B30.2/SPRY domain-containing protein n=1 Tax=Heterodera trifolii TaxID=157864 RepID=A0ABD2LBL6_9BILA